MALLFAFELLRLQPLQALSVCSECDAHTSKVLNTSVEFNKIFQKAFPTDYKFSLSEMRPGICEATIAFIAENFIFITGQEQVSTATELRKILCT